MRSFPKGSKFYFGTGAGKAITESINSAKHSIKVISPYLSSDKLELLGSKAAQGVNVTVITQYDENASTNENSKSLSAILKCVVEQRRTYTQEEVNTKTERIIIQKVRLPENERVRDIKLKRSWLHLLWVLVGVIISIAFITVPIPFIARFSTLVTVFRYSAAIIALSVFLVHAIDAMNRDVAEAMRLPVTKDERTICSFPNHTKKTLCEYEYIKKPFLTLMFAKRGVGDKYNSILHCKMYIIDDAIAYIGSMNLTNYGFSNNYELRVKFTDKNDVTDIVSAFETIFSEIECVDLSSEYPRVFDEDAKSTFEECFEEY